MLRFDRQYGAMGGQSPILFTAIDCYAHRYGIEGEEFDIFRHLLTAIDTEWLLWAAEREKEEAARRRPR